nr:hypothetical protein [Tanacetum cinerariifolium]
PSAATPAMTANTSQKGSRLYFCGPRVKTFRQSKAWIKWLTLLTLKTKVKGSILTLARPEKMKTVEFIPFYSMEHLVGVFAKAMNDYYTHYHRHPRIVAWSSKHKFYRHMLKPMSHGRLPVEKVVPDETEARTQ